MDMYNILCRYTRDPEDEEPMKCYESQLLNAGVVFKVPYDANGRTLYEGTYLDCLNIVQEEKILDGKRDMYFTYELVKVKEQ